MDALLDLALANIGFVLHRAVDLGEQGVVAAHAHVFAGMDHGAELTDKDIAELRVLLSEMDVAQAEADCDALATFNRAFHSKIEHLSDKTRILRVIDDQEEYITRFAAITIASIVRRSNAHQEHHQMVDLLEKRDLPGMMKLMEHHLDESKQTCLEAVSNHKY